MLHGGPSSHSTNIYTRIRYCWYTCTYRLIRAWRNITTTGRKFHSYDSTKDSINGTNNYYYLSICLAIALCLVSTILFLTWTSVWLNHPSTTIQNIPLDGSSSVDPLATTTTAENHSTFSTLLSHLNPCPDPAPTRSISNNVGSDENSSAERNRNDHASESIIQSQLNELREFRVKIIELEAALTAATASARNASVADQIERDISIPVSVDPIHSIHSISSSSFSNSYARCEKLGGGKDGIPATLHCHTDVHGHWISTWLGASISALIAPSSVGSDSESIRTNLPEWTWYRPMSRLISSWERAQFDWHLLIPPRQRGDSDDIALDRLIAKEKSVMSLLLTARSTMQFGPISMPLFNPDLQFCSKLADKCVLHRDDSECNADGFCVWAPAPMDLCVSRRTPQPDGVDSPSSLWPKHVYNEGGKWRENPNLMSDVYWPIEMTPINSNDDASAQSSSDGVASSAIDPALPGFQSFSHVSLAASISNPDKSPVLHSFGFSLFIDNVAGGWSTQRHKGSMQRSDCDVFIHGDSFVLDMGNNGMLCTWYWP
jgi:hypothetical protein